MFDYGSTYLGGALDVLRMGGNKAGLVLVVCRHCGKLEGS